MRISTLVYTFLAIMLSLHAVGQNSNIDEIGKVLQKNVPDLKYADTQNLHLDAEHISSLSGIHYMYLNQSINEIRIKNSTINAAFAQDGTLERVTGNPLENLDARAEDAQPGIELITAVQRTISALGIQGSVSATQLSEHEFKISIDGGNYHHESNAELVYWITPEKEVKLAWNFNIDLFDESHWYDFIISAKTGEELTRIDWQVSCNHTGDHAREKDDCRLFGAADNSFQSKRTTLDGSTYNVFPFPAESPNHGNRDILTEPAVSISSPFGWHDINGSPGADFTITRGNNVFAYEDSNDGNFPGQSPDGGAELEFDYPLNLAATPETYQSAAITNLFYANNLIHDILYVYGFDESAGNFQSNNYGNGGFDGDEVRAEAQDGGGLNNANMATPGDGANPRMQMYLWDTGTLTSSFTVEQPVDIAGSYTSSAASAFGPALPTEGLSGEVVLVENGGSPSNGCSDIENIEEISGKVAILYRGGCSFTAKVVNAQDAGAIAVIVINNVVGEIPFQMGGVSSDVTIPSLMVGFSDGNLIVEKLNENETVEVTFADFEPSAFKDGSFDNGIVIHEYIHGLSNRLTGGANNSSCLFGDEQMGEGWSDWYALMMTMNLDLPNPTYRPMGTFANGEPIDGIGIRPVPYDTSFSVNSFTYANLPNQGLSVPHGVGFVWSTMLWDLTWALIDEYGFDPDLINGSSGNNMALQLVTEGLKLQPCQPGFVDGRDAILLADQLLFDGANECLIWEVFARRGLGVNADQGSALSRDDGTASFELPAICQEVFFAPTASFTTSTEFSCTGIVEFFDESEDIPQAWLWDFGDGNTSEEQNPIHQYEEEGVYSVSLTVSNELGEDESVQSNLIEYSTLQFAQADGVSGCAGEEATLTAASPDGNEIRWLNAENEQIALGNDLQVVFGLEDSVYFAQNYAELPSVSFAGPESNLFGTGGNHGTDFVGTVNFETFEPVTIVSAFVVSGEPGSRAVTLFSDASGGGNPIETKIIDIDFTGPGRVDMNFEIDQPGIYSIGLNQANLYRNDFGANYPYEVDGVINIFGSSAGVDFYYYFYDLEVSTRGCVSEPVEVTTTVTGEALFSAEDDGLTVSFDNESPTGSSWFWDFGDGNTSTEQNPVHTYDEMGNYLVTLTVDNGCSATTEVPVGTTSAEIAERSDGFKIFPNPAAEVFYLDNSAHSTERMVVAIYDLNGKEIIRSDFLGERIEINSAELNSGVYFIAVWKRGESKVLYRDKLTIVE